MTNEEKALELMPATSGNYEIMDALLNMAQWKDKQFAEQKQALIDKACEWLSKWEDPYYDKGLVEGFKKAMKGGNDE